MKQIFSQLLDLVLPPAPEVRLARSLSEKRWGELYAPREIGVSVFALFPYRDESVRALIKAAKYHAEEAALAVPGRFLGDFVVELIADKRSLAGWGTPYILAMPASRERVRERGYNQAERVLAAALPHLGSAAAKAEEILFRENRESQVSVARSERAQNIRNAFYIKNPEATRGNVFIIIDDVIESGSTFADAKRALIEGGAQEVIGIALAH